MAITINNNPYTDGLEVINLKATDNLLILKVSTELNYKMAITNDFKFYNLKFKPNRLHEDKIKYAVMMFQGKILASYILNLENIIYDAKKGEIKEIEVTEVNLKFDGESLTNKNFDYKTKYSATTFPTKNLIEREI